MYALIVFGCKQIEPKVVNITNTLEELNIDKFKEEQLNNRYYISNVGWETWRKYYILSSPLKEIKCNCINNMMVAKWDNFQEVNKLMKEYCYPTCKQFEDWYVTYGY